MSDGGGGETMRIVDNYLREYSVTVDNRGIPEFVWPDEDEEEAEEGDEGCKV